MKLIVLLFAFFWAGTPALASEVTLKSLVFVERIQKDDKGNSKTVLEEPKMVTPGDKLLFVLAYKNEGAAPATDFVINNPLPQAVLFTGTESGDAVMSVDGGKSWGELNQLKVTQADGSVRAALAADVTHVKWQFTRPIPAGAEGKVNFRAIVK